MGEVGESPAQERELPKCNLVSNSLQKANFVTSMTEPQVQWPLSTTPLSTPKPEFPISNFPFAQKRTPAALSNQVPIAVASLGLVLAVLRSCCAGFASQTCLAVSTSQPEFQFQRPETSPNSLGKLTLAFPGCFFGEFRERNARWSKGIDENRYH